MLDVDYRAVGTDMATNAEQEVSPARQRCACLAFLGEQVECLIEGRWLVVLEAHRLRGQFPASDSRRHSSRIAGSSGPPRSTVARSRITSVLHGPRKISAPASIGIA